MQRPGLERDVVDPGVYERTVRRFAEAGIVMPTFAQLADPETVDPGIAATLDRIDPDAADIETFNERTRAIVPA